MQGLADGYFVIPYTIGGFLAKVGASAINTDAPEVKDVEKEAKDRIERILNIKGNKTVHEIHKELGLILWNYVGMSRNKKGLEKAIQEIPKVREEFWKNVKVTGSGAELNKSLEEALRLADFLELGELIARDALMREESCGGHFRTEHITEEGEAKRDDNNFTFVSAWEYKGENQEPEMHKENLEFEFVELTQRSYK